MASCFGFSPDPRTGCLIISIVFAVIVCVNLVNEAVHKNAIAVTISLVSLSSPTLLFMGAWKKISGLVLASLITLLLPFGWVAYTLIVMLFTKPVRQYLHITSTGFSIHCLKATFPVWSYVVFFAVLALIIYMAFITYHLYRLFKDDEYRRTTGRQIVPSISEGTFDGATAARLPTVGYLPGFVHTSNEDSSAMREMPPKYTEIDINPEGQEHV